MDKAKLKKLFHELKATTSDVIFTLFMFSMLYLLIQRSLPITEKATG